MWIRGVIQKYNSHKANKMRNSSISTGKLCKFPLVSFFFFSLGLASNHLIIVQYVRGNVLRCWGEKLAASLVIDSLINTTQQCFDQKFSGH